MVRHVDGAALPAWVLHATETAPGPARPAAVLMLLADGAAGPDLLLTQRSDRLASHAGQPAFPGGALEAGEGPVSAALREANEETGLDPAGVVAAAVLPSLYLRPSRFVVHPVLAHWRQPGPVEAVDPAETVRVVRVPVTDLADPAHRGTVVLPPGGVRGLTRALATPAFDVAGLIVWGFTAGLVDLLLDWGGWTIPWDRHRMLIPPALRGGGALSMTTSPPAQGTSPFSTSEVGP